MNSVNPLVGKIIRSVWLSEGGGAIKFVTDDGEVIARADGDCCSHTWIENVENVEALIGREIMEVAETCDGSKSDDDYEVVQFYGCNISSVGGGTCKIDYRNSSNGYYGGNLDWGGEDSYFYGGVFGQNGSTNGWQEVK
jgi:hypothetical protein